MKVNLLMHLNRQLWYLIVKLLRVFSNKITDGYHWGAGGMAKFVVHVSIEVVRPQDQLINCPCPASWIKDCVLTLGYNGGGDLLQSGKCPETLFWVLAEGRRGGKTSGPMPRSKQLSESFIDLNNSLTFKQQLKKIEALKNEFFYQRGFYNIVCITRGQEFYFPFNHRDTSDILLTLKTALDNKWIIHNGSS